MEHAKNGASDLAATRAALTSWRRRYGGRGRWIPEELWSRAAAVARVHGVGATARALRLDEARLTRRVGDAAAIAPRATLEPMAFVELGGVEVRAARGGAVIELVGREGDRMRVEVAELDVVSLARAFWSRGA